MLASLLLIQYFTTHLRREQLLRSKPVVDSLRIIRRLAKVKSVIVEIVSSLFHRFCFISLIQRKDYHPFSKLFRVYVMDVGICFSWFNHYAILIYGIIDSNVYYVFDIYILIIYDVAL